MARASRRHGRGEQLDRALRLVAAFHDRPHVGVTIDELAAALECSRRSAYRWLEAAILSLPIQRVASHPVRYRLLSRSHQDRAA